MFRHRCRSFVSVLAVGAIAGALPATPATAAPLDPWFPEVVVFGDSLSDPGNLFAVTGEHALAPFAPIPSAPYAVGGGHFTNGETWVERLAHDLKAPSGTGPAARVPGVFTNYAFGGARARSGGPSASPDLDAQVAMYLGNTGGVAASDALYVVWFGANDVRDALQALAVDPSGATSVAIVQAAIAALQRNVLLLWSQGARTFLVPNVPNIAFIPAVATQPPAVRGAATFLSGAYNAGLGQLLTGLGQLPGARIVRLDVFSLLNAVVTSPAAYGLEDAVHPCLTFGVVAEAICAEPGRYVFWDAVHPTTTVHGVLAAGAAQALAP